MWKQLVTRHCPTAKFRAPAQGAALAAAKQEIGLLFDEQLRACLLETNGIITEYGLTLIWPLERIVKDNQAFRRNLDFKDLYMPFDCLLFFGDAGNGDQFAFPIQAGAIRNHDIFVWDHENDSGTWIAPSLATFVEWWLTDKIKV